MLTYNNATTGLVNSRPEFCPITSNHSYGGHGETTSVAPNWLTASNLIALVMWCQDFKGHGQQSITARQRIFCGANQFLTEFGFHPVYLPPGIGGHRPNDAEREAAQLQYVLDRGFGGAIFCPSETGRNESLLQQCTEQLAVAVVEHRVPSVDADFVGIDGYQTMLDTVKILVEQGHRRIAFVTGSERTQVVRDRLLGYVEAARRMEIGEVIVQMASNGDNQAWTAFDATFLTGDGRRPTAAIAFGDNATCGIVERLQRLGLSVPRDVAVAGFDYIAPDCQYGTGLRSFSLPYEEMGRHAAKLLLRRIEDPSAPFASIKLPGEIN
jgi:DNA-binding LacI/PurR family transcriptional regulator